MFWSFATLPQLSLHRYVHKAFLSVKHVILALHSRNFPLNDYFTYSKILQSLLSTPVLASMQCCWYYM